MPSFGWCCPPALHACMRLVRSAQAAGPSLSLTWTVSSPQLDVPDCMHAIRDIKLWAQESPHDGQAGTCYHVCSGCAALYISTLLVIKGCQDRHCLSACSTCLRTSTACTIVLCLCVACLAPAAATLELSPQPSLLATEGALQGLIGEDQVRVRGRWTLGLRAWRIQ
jgi:hypothetical protein